MGHVVMAVCLVACGIVAIAFFYVINPHSKIPCIGASGAISGMMGMYLVIFPRARMDLKVYVLQFHVRTFSTSSVGAVGAWIGEQILLGVFGSATRVSFGVAFWAHVGGVLAGIGLGLALTRSGFPIERTGWPGKPDRKRPGLRPQGAGLHRSTGRPRTLRDRAR